MAKPDHGAETLGETHCGDTNVVDDRSTGLCGAKINNDPYLILMSSQHDKVSNDGQVMGKIFGDTCRGNPPW